MFGSESGHTLELTTPLTHSKQEIWSSFSHTDEWEIDKQRESALCIDSNTISCNDPPMTQNTCAILKKGPKLVLKDTNSCNLSTN